MMEDRERSVLVSVRWWPYLSVLALDDSMTLNETMTLRGIVTPERHVVLPVCGFL
jgi:hypothetical protein